MSMYTEKGANSTRPGFPSSTALPSDFCQVNSNKCSLCLHFHPPCKKQTQAALLQEDPKEKDSSQKGGGSRKEQGEGKPRSSTAQPAVAASGDLSGEVWRRQHQSVRSREPGGRCTEGLGSMAAKDSRDGAGGEAQVGWMWGGVLPGRVVWEQGGAYEGDW